MRYLIAVLALFLCSCDGQNSWTGTTQESGGIWVGPDYVLLIAEDGRLIWWDSLFERFGDGNAITHIDNLSVAFAMYGPGDPGTAVCTGMGTVAQRQSTTLTLECVSTDGIDRSEYPESVLDYDSLYDRDSSLATIAGLYDIFENGTEIIDINADGTLFSQDAVTECVANGRVNVIDPNYNLYDVSLTLSDCNAANDELNGLTSSGFFVLDNESAPGEELLLYIGITRNAGETDGVWFDATKL